MKDGEGYYDKAVFERSQIEEHRRNREIDYIFKLCDIPIWFFLMIFFVAINISLLTKKWNMGVLIGYAFIILGETVLFRTQFDGQHFQPHLFWSYKVWNIQKKQIIANVLLFIPLGFLVGSLWKWRGVIVGAGFSIVIELLQLINQRGLFEFDDILHNTVGTFIGIFIYMLAETLVIRKRNKDGLYKRSEIQRY